MLTVSFSVRSTSVPVMAASMHTNLDTPFMRSTTLHIALLLSIDKRTYAQATQPSNQCYSPLAHAMHHAAGLSRASAPGMLGSAYAVISSGVMTITGTSCVMLTDD